MSYDPGSKLHKLWKQQQRKTKLLISLSVIGLVLFIGISLTFPLKGLIFSLFFPKDVSLASQTFGNSQVSPYPLDFGIISQSQPTITKELTINNLGSTPSALPVPDWDYAKKEGQALSFNGGDTYVDLGTPSSLDALLTSDFTISLWINPTPKANQNSVILARGDSFSSEQNKFILIYLDQGKLTASLRGDNGEKSSTSISSQATIPPNTWTHLTLVRKRSTSLGMVKKDTSTRSPGRAVLSATNSASPSATITPSVSPSPSPTPLPTLTPSPSPSPTSISQPSPTPLPSPPPTPTSELVLFINGKEEGRVKDNSGSITFVREKGSRPLSLGSAFLGSSNTPSYQGLMDDLMIFNRTLSGEEITGLSNSTLPTTITNQTGLLGYFKFDEGKFDEGQGGTLNDSSPYGNKGQVKGSSSFPFGRITIPTPITFNTTSNNTSPYLRMDSHPALDKMLKDSFTISGWAKYQGSGNKILVGQGDTYAGEQNKFILIYLDQSGKLTASLRGDNGEKNTTSIFGKTSIKAGEWFHYSLVRQRNASNQTPTLTLYLNGLPDSDPIPDQAGDLTFTKDRPLTLGAANVGSSTNATTSLFQGLMDDIRVYNQALTLNQVKDLYQQKVDLSNQSSYPQSSNLPHPQPLPPLPSTYTLSLKTPTPGYTLESSPSAFILLPQKQQTSTLTLKPDLNTLKEGAYSNELILNIDQTNYSIPISFNYSIPLIDKIGLGGKTVPGPSPTPQPEEVIKNLTNQLLRDGRQPGQLGALSEEMKAQTLQSVASQRKEVMLGLAESNPKQFLKYALPKAVRERFPQNIQSFFEQEATVSGTLTITHVDDFDNPQNSKLLYRVETSDNRSYNLHFTELPPELTPNSRVTVGGFTIESEMVVDPQQVSQEPVIRVQTGGLSTVGEQRVLVILANFQNDTSQPVTQDFVRSLMFTGSSSVDRFYREASGGRTWLTGDVVGWYTIPYTNTNCFGNYSAWGGAAEAVASASGVNINNYQRKVYVLPLVPNCQGGFGEFDGGAWIFAYDSPFVYAHELGHVLRLHHANRYRCGSKQVDIDSNCQSQEYGDETDVMGNNAVRYFNAPHRNSLGWLNIGNVQNVTASGTYTIQRLGRSGSTPQVLRIRRWGEEYRPNEFYYVSLRDPVGFDAALDPTFTRGSSVHLWDGSWASNIIDIVPNTQSLEALEDGGIFRDEEADLTITQISHNDDSATLRVNFGPGRSCIRQNPQVTVIPFLPSSFLPYYNPGDDIAYRVGVLNNDTRFCGGSTTFNLTDSRPYKLRGPSSINFSGSMTLSPRALDRQIVVIAIRPATESGIYDVSFTATNRDNPAYSMTVTKSVITLSQPTSFTISLRVKIPGIGASDVNTNPVRRTRTVQVSVFDRSNREVGEVSANLTLGGDYFVGNVPIQNLPNGQYFFKVKLDNSLIKLINTSPVDVVSGGTVVLPATTFIMGDVNNDNVINISDFTQLRPCFFKNTSSPDWNTCQASDFNDDGRISVTDYSRIITNFNRRGDSIPTSTAQLTTQSTKSTTTLPSPSPTPSSSFLVKPYLVYPADKPMYPQYESAVRDYLVQLQNWYREKVGVTFRMTSLQVVRSQENYLVMRCGPNPSPACQNDPSKLEGNWGMYMNKAIHNGIERWEEQTAALVFGAGGGGYAGSNQYQNYAGWAIVGDWVLEPLSGKVSEWGIPCRYSNGWQCQGGVPGGTPAHELGHAFGLPHPDEQLYPGRSIMRWHGDYPTVGFFPHEVGLLKQSLFFTVSPSPSPTPRTCTLDQLKSAFGSSRGDPSYQPACDINNDGRISVIDYSALLQRR